MKKKVGVVTFAVTTGSDRGSIFGLVRPITDLFFSLIFPSRGCMWYACEISSAAWLARGLARVLITPRSRNASCMWP